MPTIIRTPFRVSGAEKFVLKYADPVSTEKTYLAIGHDTPWIDEQNPPAPLDSRGEAKANYDALLGAHLISQTDMSMVVPRIDWVAAKEFFVLDEASPTPWTQETYVLTSTFRVYRCVAKDITGALYANPPLSTTEPSGSVSLEDTADGYKWEFLYNVTPYEQTTMLTPTWLPVAWGAGIKETTLQTASGRVDANKLLDTKYVMMRARLLDTDLDIGISYRKLSLIINPVDVATGVAAVATNYINPSDPNNLITPGASRQWAQYSGETIYQENRSPVARTTGQFEEIKIIIEF